MDDPGKSIASSQKIEISHINYAFALLTCVIHVCVDLQTLV